MLTHLPVLWPGREHDINTHFPIKEREIDGPNSKLTNLPVLGGRPLCPEFTALPNIREREPPNSRLTKYPVLGPIRETDIDTHPTTREIEHPNSTLTHLPVIEGSREPEFNTTPDKRGRIPQLEANPISGTRWESLSRV